MYCIARQCVNNVTRVLWWQACVCVTVIVPVYVHSICVYIAQYSVRFAVQYVLNVYCTYVLYVT